MQIALTCGLWIAGVLVGIGIGLSNAPKTELAPAQLTYAGYPRREPLPGSHGRKDGPVLLAVTLEPFADGYTLILWDHAQQPGGKPIELARSYVMEFKK